MNGITSTHTLLENGQPAKPCRRCGKILPLTDFYKNNQQADGLTGKCRYCMSEVRKGWDKKYNVSEKARQTARRYYYSEKGQRAKREYRQAYQPTPEQRERYRAAQRAKASDPKRKAQIKKYWQSEKGRARKAIKDKQYAKTEAGRFAKRKTEIKRKHQIKTSDCTLTRGQWQEIKEKFNHSCAYCGRKMERLEMDHVIPLSRGGKHTAGNIVPACRKCNATKGNKILEPETPEVFGI